MRRYATAPLSTFEDLFDRARSGIVRLDAMEYPPVCAERSGEVSFALGRTGAMIMHVGPGECSSQEFRLRLLFETGACVFSSSADLGHFCTGALAAAFEIEAAEPIAPSAVTSEADSDESGAAGEPGAQTLASSADDLLADLGTGMSKSTKGTYARNEPEEPRDTSLFPTVTDTAIPQNPPSHPPPIQILTAASLATELARVIHGQEPALERVASAAVAQLTKRHPARPGSVLLVGATGVGKTATIEALPSALKALGLDDASVFRIDCGELTDSIQVTRLLGSPPGYSGHAQTTPLLMALERPRCILLVDELEKAHPDVFDLLLGLLDAGRVTRPGGQTVDARHIVVALTTSGASDRLSGRLRGTPLHDRWAVQRACAEHLRSTGLPADLVARIGAFAVYAELEGDDARRGVARAAIIALGREYGLIVGRIDPVVLEVVEDIASDLGTAGARALHHASSELLAEGFAELAADGPRIAVAIDAGPPVTVSVAKGERRAA